MQRLRHTTRVVEDARPGLSSREASWGELTFSRWHPGRVSGRWPGAAPSRIPRSGRLAVEMIDDLIASGHRPPVVAADAGSLGAGVVGGVETCLGHDVAGETGAVEADLRSAGVVVAAAAACMGPPSSKRTELSSECASAGCPAIPHGRVKAVNPRSAERRVTFRHGSPWLIKSRLGPLPTKRNV